MWIEETEEARREAQARASAQGVEAKARELCKAAGDNPDKMLMDFGAQWRRYVGRARIALGLDDAEGAK